MNVLSDLAETLPTIQSQVADIRVVYDSGREKVRHSFICRILIAKLGDILDRQKHLSLS